MSRASRVPGYDTQVHIVKGGDAKSGSAGIAQQADDALLEHDDPMEFGAGSGEFGSQSIEEILNKNAAQAASLDSGAGIRGDSVNMGQASSNSDPGKGASSYGPRNTGKSRK